MGTAIEALNNLRAALNKVTQIDEQIIINAAKCDISYLQRVNYEGETVLIHVYKLPKGWLQNGNEKSL